MRASRISLPLRINWCLVTMSSLNPSSSAMAMWLHAGRSFLTTLSTARRNCKSCRWNTWIFICFQSGTDIVTVLCLLVEKLLKVVFSFYSSLTGAVPTNRGAVPVLCQEGFCFQLLVWECWRRSHWSCALQQVRVKISRLSSQFFIWIVNCCYLVHRTLYTEINKSIAFT